MNEQTSDAAPPRPITLQTRDPRTARTWAEVDLDRIRTNAAALRRWLAPTGNGNDLLAVVKADAYGHGAARVALASTAAGVSHFGVASLAEALPLRQAGISGDIYLLSPFLPEEAEAIVRADLIPMLSSWEQFEALRDASRAAPLPARCFLKVDTGMGRSGANAEAARDLWRRLAELDSLRVTGLATHLSSADEFGEEAESATRAQAEAFYACATALFEEHAARADDGRGNSGVWLSLENSPGALQRDLRREPLPGVRGHLVRAGLLLYGIEPFRGALADLPEIRPVLTWRARVTLLRDLPEGATVGYGRTRRLARPTRVATLAAGYADGLSRRLSNCGFVLLRGTRCPILGRVSMDQCQIDVTDVPGGVSLGDAAVLIGEDGENMQTALDLAACVDTTPHEPTCALTRRVPRLYVRP